MTFYHSAVGCAHCPCVYMIYLVSLYRSCPHQMRMTLLLLENLGAPFLLNRDLSKCEEERQKIVLDTRNKYVYCRFCTLNQNSPFFITNIFHQSIFRQCDLASFQSIKDFVTQFNKQVNTILKLFSLRYG